MSVGQRIRHFLKFILFVSFVGFVVIPFIFYIGEYFYSGSLEKFFAFTRSLHSFFEGPKKALVDGGVFDALGQIISGVFLLFLAPGGLVFRLLDSQIGYSQFIAVGGVVEKIALFFIFFLSWVFWSTLYVRTMRFIGIWDPFKNVHERKKGLVLGWLVRLRDWWEISTKFGKQTTGKWASLLEVINQRFCAGDIFLGRPKLFIGGMMRPVGISTEKHICTIAQTGSGKSTAALIPNLSLHEGSLLCIDPKGELAEITAQRRGMGNRKGYGLEQGFALVDPFRLTLDSSTASARYNPFDEIELVTKTDPDRAVSYASKIAEALVRPMSEKESYWDEAAKTLIRGLVLYIFVHEPKDKRNLMRLRQLIMEGDVEGFDEAIEAGVIDPKEDKDLNPFDFLLERMKQSRGEEYGDPISSAASSISMMGDNQAGSVITTAQQHTSFLDIPEIRKVSEGSDFSLEDLKNTKMSIYLILPLNLMKGDAGRWLRMFVLLFIDMMMRVQDAPKPPVLLAIDEFPSLGRLDGIEVIAPVMRSYGVRFWAVAQDVSQLKAVYPDTWTGFLGGAEAIQFMGITHQATVDLLVDLLGKGEVFRSDGQRRFREERALLDREQISKFLSPKNKNQIIWFGDRRPMKLKICPYYDYLTWWYYWPDKRFKEKFIKRFWRLLLGKKHL